MKVTSSPERNMQGPGWHVKVQMHVCEYWHLETTLPHLFTVGKPGAVTAMK